MVHATRAVNIRLKKLILGAALSLRIPGRLRRLRHLQLVAVASCTLALTLLLPQSSEAKSAFAAGIPDDVAVQGVALGTGYDYSTREGAEERALQECRVQQDAPDSTRALCKIVDHFDNRCIAISLDPKAGTPGFGWAVANSEDTSNDQALAMCRQSAGSDRAPYCVVTLSECDTNSAGPK